MNIPLRQTVYTFSLLAILLALYFVLYADNGFMRVLRGDGFDINGASNLANSRPRPKEPIENITIHPHAFILVLMDPEGNEKVLAQKDADAALPIASVTKLVTALTIEKLFSGTEIISIPNDILKDKGSSDRFHAGEEYRAEEMLSALLIESNNDAAEAFSRKIGDKKFVGEMNAIAASLGLEHSTFVSPSGLDGIDINRSSARDISRVLKEIFLRHPRIASILGRAESEICTADSSSCYVATTTNALLLDPAFPMRIQGGKTGDTPVAGKNLALAVSAPTPGWILISVVLGSDDHFRDTKKIFEWAKESFEWPQ